MSTDAWVRAQLEEIGYWYCADPVEHARRREEEAQHQLWYRGLLGITPNAVRSRDVLDIGGGPCPLVADPSLPLSLRTVVDPLPVREDIDPTPVNVMRFTCPAEDLNLNALFDEVWLYNVLQHVVSPTKVVEAAHRHVRKTLRWFEWLDTPITAVHPNSIDQAFMHQAFDGFKVVRHVSGTARSTTWAQNFIAIVGER